MRHQVEPNIVESRPELLKRHVGLGVVALATGWQQVVRPVAASAVERADVVYGSPPEAPAVRAPTSKLGQGFAAHEIVHTVYFSAFQGRSG